MAEGAQLDNVVFDMAQLDKTTSTAVIYTGTYPNVNGITGATVYNEEARRVTLILNDPKFIGNATDETLSPMAIKVSTKQVNGLRLHSTKTTLQPSQPATC